MTRWNVVLDEHDRIAEIRLTEEVIADRIEIKDGCLLFWNADGSFIGAYRKWFWVNPEGEE
jgi:hypothetical protein